MARRHIETKQRVAELIAEGLNHTQIARALGVAKHTVSYHARTLGRPADPRFTRRYDWTEVQHYYDEGHSVTECQERFGSRERPGTQHDAAAMSWHGRTPHRSSSSSSSSRSLGGVGISSAA